MLKFYRRMDQGSFSVSKQSWKSETLVGWKLKVSVSISQTSHPQTSIPIFDAFKLHKKKGACTIPSDQHKRKLVSKMLDIITNSRRCFADVHHLICLNWDWMFLADKIIHRRNIFPKKFPYVSLSLTSVPVEKLQSRALLNQNLWNFSTEKVNSCLNKPRNSFVYKS